MGRTVLCGTLKWDLDADKGVVLLNKYFEDQDWRSQRDALIDWIAYLQDTLAERGFKNIGDEEIDAAP